MLRHGVRERRACHGDAADEAYRQADGALSGQWALESGRALERRRGRELVPAHLDQERFLAVLEHREQGLESDGNLFSAHSEKAAYVDHHADDAPGRVDEQVIDRSNLLLVGTLDRSPEIFGRKQRVARLLDDVEAARGWRRRRLP